jgi:uncharacterized NAD(P)/FAD-binding protein YdhS
LAWLVGELDACKGPIDESTAWRVLGKADLTPAEVAPYVEERAGSYARRCVVRRENYELLVLTWMPSQGSVAHDHSGSLCGLKVVAGNLTEQHFDEGPDGHVRLACAARPPNEQNSSEPGRVAPVVPEARNRIFSPTGPTRPGSETHAQVHRTWTTGITQVGTGQIIVDPGVIVHALRNDSTTDLLVTVHIYSPPLPEVRRYAVADHPPAAVFVRKPAAGARVVAIIGGGFTGTMALANLLRFANQSNQPLHIAMIDGQAAFGEGVAYRTNDARHLLNVPAGRMSAWPDLPDDFLEHVRSTDASVKPTDFLPRKIYGRYVRQTLMRVAESAGVHLSVEIIRDEATALSPLPASGWTIETAAGRSVRADVTAITLGHRPPDDPFLRRWTGPRNRFVANPWAALVLSQIGRDEPVLLLGSGLTAVDAILTLDHPDRTGKLVAVSRRGLMPMPHSREPLPAMDLSNLIAELLDPNTPLTVRRLVSDIRQKVAEAAQSNTDWRQVIDGLRSAVPKLWTRLDLAQRSRFLCHVRSFWEIHRHRMAPAVADTIARLRREKKLEVVAGALLSAKADEHGVDVTLSCRGGSTTKAIRVSWVINCTGPGVQNRHGTHPVLRPLIQAGILCDDELSLGLRTDEVGRAIDANGRIHETLLVAGTLRKSTLWESTAVPELCQQAQVIAKAALANLVQGAGLR